MMALSKHWPSVVPKYGVRNTIALAQHKVISNNWQLTSTTHSDRGINNHGIQPSCNPTYQYGVRRFYTSIVSHAVEADVQVEYTDQGVF